MFMYEYSDLQLKIDPIISYLVPIISIISTSIMIGRMQTYDHRHVVGYMLNSYM